MVERYSCRNHGAGPCGSQKKCLSNQRRLTDTARRGRDACLFIVTKLRSALATVVVGADAAGEGGGGSAAAL